MELEKVSKSIGIVTAVFALVTGGWTLSDKVGIFKKPILTFAPQHFSITDGPAHGEFRVVVAREKHRDDCSVEQFKLEVRDSELQVHEARSSIPVFSGPASPKIDSFGYRITLANPEKVAVGTATLMARINYKCPEGNTVITYPDHENLRFNITK